MAPYICSSLLINVLFPFAAPSRRNGVTRKQVAIVLNGSGVIRTFPLPCDSSLSLLPPSFLVPVDSDAYTYRTLLFLVLSIYFVGSFTTRTKLPHAYRVSFFLSLVSRTARFARLQCHNAYRAALTGKPDTIKEVTA